MKLNLFTFGQIKIGGKFDFCNILKDWREIWKLFFKTFKYLDLFTFLAVKLNLFTFWQIKFGSKLYFVYFFWQIWNLNLFWLYKLIRFDPFRSLLNPFEPIFNFHLYLGLLSKFFCPIWPSNLVYIWAVKTTLKYYDIRYFFFLSWAKSLVVEVGRARSSSVITYS